MHLSQHSPHIYGAQHLLAAVRMLAARKQIDVRQGADAIEAKLEAACLAAFRVATDAGHAHAADTLGAVLQTPLVLLLTRAYYSGYTLGSVALKAAELRTARRTPVVKKVTSAQRQAAAWAEQHAAETIKGITETTRDEIRFVITRLLDQDVSLTSKEAHDLIAKTIGDKKRAQLIARTEIMRAVHEGQRQSWKDAADRGDLSARVRRRWITAHDEATCPICLPLDKKRATLDGEYPGGFDGPPAHPACRCTEQIA